MEYPPAYEQFIIEEPGEENRDGRITKILRPVMRVVDPVARKWAQISTVIDEMVSRVMHPLLAKRLFFLVITYLAFYMLYRGDSPSPATFQDPELAESLLRDQIKIENIKHTSSYLNSIPHVAGTVSGHATAQYVHDALISYGVELVEISPEEVFLTHLDSNSLDVDYNGEKISIGLSEGAASEREQPVPHMSLGVSGTATGKLVYVNFGSRSDLNELENKGIHLKDKIAVVKYGRGNPGMTSERLREWGAVGIVFFSHKDPDTAAWPDGPDYSEESVQRACMGIPQLWPGDPLSPGWPSAHHLTVDIGSVRSVVKLPIVSVSWKEIGRLLATLKGYGEHMQDWHNNGYPTQVEEWWTGDQTEDSPVATITVKTIDEQRHTIYNVLGRIGGQEQADSGVFIGASLDTFCQGGVKISGLAVLLEVARALSYISFQKNWRPKRSIYFTVWDGSTQNYAGAVEWMEGISTRATHDGLIYIDLDKGISGPKLSAEGNPSIDIREIISKIDDSLTVDTGTRDIPWDFGTHDVFSSYVGVPSISLGMSGNVYPQDSCFDSIEWQEKFGDSEYTSHKTLGDIAGTLALKFADDAIVPFNFSYFASNTEAYVSDLDEYISSKLGPHYKDKVEPAFNDIRESLAKVLQGGNRAQEWSHSWHASMDATSDHLEGTLLQQLRLDWNDRMMAFNKQFLQRPGLYRRDWFKNIIFGPKYEASADQRFSGAFPGVRDLVWLSETQAIPDALQSIADVLNEAARVLLDAPYWG